MALINGSDAAESLVGTVTADTLNGLGGDDTLYGGDGADVLNGGLGNDFASYSDATSAIVVNLKNVALNTGFAAGDTYVGIEGIIGSAGADTFVSGADKTQFVSGGGADVLDYSTSATGVTLTIEYEGYTGGSGFYYFTGTGSTGDAAGDTFTNMGSFKGSSSVDEIKLTGGHYTGFGDAFFLSLATGFEKLTYTGVSSFTGVGNELNNIITGNVGNDSLSDDTGNDSLDGGAGSDTLSGGIGKDTLLGGNDNDVLNGGDGADVLNGGLGFDYASYSDATSAIVVNLKNLALNTGFAAGDSYVGIEGIVGSGGADTFVSGADKTQFVSGGGADVLDYSTSATGVTLTIEYEGYTGGFNAFYFFSGSGSTGDATGDTFTNMGSFKGTSLVDEIKLTGGHYTGFGDAFFLSLATGFEKLTYTGVSSFTGVGNELNNTITGNGGSDSLSDDVGNDSLVGGAGNDTLAGGVGSDTLSSGNDNDVLNGGDGADVLNGGLGIDFASYSDATSAIVVNLKNLALNTGFAAGDTYVGIEGIIGTAGADTFVSGADKTQFVSGGGADVLDYSSSATGVTLTIEYEGYTGGSGFYYFTGTGSTGDAAGDTFTNMGSFKGSSFVDEIKLTGGHYTGFGDAFFLSLATGFEKLTYTGTSSFTGVGNELNNIITGNVGNDSLSDDVGNDTLDGGAGNDNMFGGTGNDTYIVDSTADVVFENAGEGVDTVRANLASYTLGANIENLTYGGSGAFSGVGNELTNTVTGGAGADTLDGGTGSDTLAGGLGNDTFVVDSATDKVIENLNQGVDTVRTDLASYTLGDNVENLTYTGSAAFLGTGNGLDNRLTGGAGGDTLAGGAGNDWLDGGAGADGLSGGLGNDTYVVDASDTIAENAGEGTDTVRTGLATYTLGTNLENLVFTGSGGFVGTGNTLDNALTGNAGGDSLLGGAGNDILDGGAGADTLVGGAGNDTLVVDSASDVVTENVGEGVDTVRTNLGGYTLGANLENLTYSGASAFTGVGNTLDNKIIGGVGGDSLDGGAGNDWLEGGAGGDTLSGGLGNETYVVDSAADVVIEGLGQGTDTVRTNLASYTLGDNVENLTFTGTGAFAGAGNALNNAITGGAGNDSLSGLGGNDVLSGGAGDDTLNGGTGTDVMTGGAGADTFVFAANQSSKVLATIDQIKDFTVGTDKLAVGVVASATNAVLDQTATSFAAALTQATASITAGTIDIVVVTVTGTEAGVYVFVDSDASNTVSLAIRMNTVTGIGLGEFV